jgi:O-antigen biosynthesis protein
LDLQSENDFLKAENERLTRQLEDARKRRDDLLASLSWRLTAPVRKIADLFLTRSIAPERLEEPEKCLPLTSETYRQWIDFYDRLNASDRKEIAALMQTFPQPPPLISVIVEVTGDRAEDVAALVDSLVRQLYPQWELCAIDNASDDPGISRLFGSFTRDPRIRPVRNPRRVPSEEARNAGFAMARGTAIAFVDSSTRLAETALFEVASALIGGAKVVYSDEDQIDAAGRRSDPVFKTGWNPELFRSSDYLGSLVVFDRALSANPDIPAVGAHHIPSILCHRTSPLQSRDRKGAASVGVTERQPPVTIIIPTRDRADLLGNWLKGVLKQTAYPSIEVILVDNASREPATRKLYAFLEGDSRVRILDYPAEFNWSAMNNIAASESKGEVLLFANNDLEVIEPNWLSEIVRHVEREEVGAVGAKLLFPNRSIQHAGVFVGPEGKARHPFRLAQAGDPGYLKQLILTRNVSAVTGACLAIRRRLFDEIGGFSEGLRVSFSDVELCLRLLEKGYRIVWSAEAQLLHLESASRGSNEWRWSKEEQERLLFTSSNASFEDAFFNPNLELVEDREIGLAFPPRKSRPWRNQSSGS